jgi:hypothetical protein
VAAISGPTRDNWSKCHAERRLTKAATLGANRSLLRVGRTPSHGERVAHCKWPLASGSAGLQMVSAAARTEVASTIMPNTAVHTGSSDLSVGEAGLSVGVLIKE